MLRLLVHDVFRACVVRLLRRLLMRGGARLRTDAIGASFVCFLQDWSYEAVRRLLALH